MFGISFSEILLILMISLFVFGPEQLPQIATKLGKILTTLRNLSFNLRQQLYEQTGLKQIDNIRAEMNSTINELKQQFQVQYPLNTEPPFLNQLSESEALFQEYTFLYQPEFDFERQPELFDDNQA